MPEPVNISENLHSLSMQSFNERDPIPFSVDTPSLNNSFSPVTGNDIDRLQNLRTKLKHIPAIGYLNMNSLRGNKFQQLEQFIYRRPKH